jgi:hypothetical protein
VRRRFHIVGFCLLVLLARASASGPVAGTAVNNQAAASYAAPAPGGLATSNLVHLSVQASEAVTLVSNQSATVAPGDTVVFSHTLANTGNTSSAYDLTYSVQAASFTPQGLLLYQDLNGNGLADPGEPLIAQGGTISLSPGQSARLLMVFTVPAAATPKSAAILQITAKSQAQGATASGFDSVSVGGQALGSHMLIIESVSAAIAKPNDNLKFTIAIANQGDQQAAGVPVTIDSAAATKIIVRDTIPANTRFSAFDSYTSATPLYHIWGNPDSSYTKSPPSDWTTVDAVAFAFDPMDAGDAHTVSFVVTVNADATGQITNTAVAQDAYGGTASTSTSNTVTTTVPSLAPEISYYSDDQYTRAVQSSRIGSPLFVQALASACD